jgi:hypothetical protein
MVHLRIGSIVRHLFYRKGKPEAPSARVVKGSRYTKYSFTLDALSLNPSGFCNTRVKGSRKNKFTF